MRWANPQHKHNPPEKVKTYTIKPGSPLDIPKVLLVRPHHLEDELNEYFSKQANEQALVLAMYEIYRIYKEHHFVDVRSTHSRVLQNRHERVVVEFIKQNAEHLEALKTYFK